MVQENVTREDDANMSIETKVVALKKKHASLDENLSNENRRPVPDAPTISAIKREKLNIKDEIERIT
ncbi:MAG: hypothetical protein ACJAU6_002591 [Alphaproteobacteria bacterium]|jgi:hypothetical protein